MRTVLAFAAAAGVAALFWFLRGSSDSTVLAAKDAQIAAIQQTVKAKDDLATQLSVLIHARETSIKELQDKLKLVQDSLTQNQAQLDADKIAYQKLHDADQTIINSLKGDNNADIQSLKEQLQFKDEQIAQLNEKLVQAITQYESQLNDLRGRVGSAQETLKKIYPKDDGFEFQDVGTGFFSYRYFGGSIRNPTNVEMPPDEPNHTPWTFVKDAGVAANGCGFYVTNAPNGDNDGKRSTLGQAAFLEFKDSAFSQGVDLPAGAFSVTFSYEARRDYSPNEIAVSLDGHVVFTGGPLATDHFVEVTTDSIKLPAGKHALKFLALGDGSDGGFPCTFIDNVSINILNAHHLPPRKAEDKASEAAAGAPHL